MQDRYAGDVGDFGKFSLLRSLVDNTEYKLGVIWYLFPDESHNGDGGHIDYLTKAEFKNCDKYLCEKLSTVVNGHRSVAELEKKELLPVNTVYFSDRLDFHLKYPSQKKRDKEDRKAKRQEWLNRALIKTSDCSAIFLDPDNGLQIESCSKINQMKSGKFAYYSEIAPLTKGKAVSIIYHHLNRHKNHGTHGNQIRTRLDELRKIINPTGAIFALRYRPYSPRVYFILTDKSEENRIEECLMTFLSGSKGRFWDSYEKSKNL